MNHIAVIVPVYNGEQTLESCIRSVFLAGTRISEIIIIDDGSTDNTFSIAKKLCEDDSRVRVIHTDNHGSYMARATGIKMSSAEYIAFIDSDDRYYEDSLNLLADLMESQGADVAVGGYAETSDPGNSPMIIPDKRTVKIYTPEELWTKIMKWKTQDFFCYLWHKLYKRELFEGMIAAEGLCQGDDVLLTCQVFLRARKTVETAAPVYLYSINSESLTHGNFSDHDLDLITVWDEIIRLMESQNQVIVEPSLETLARYNRWRTDFTLICRLILANDREKDRKYAENLKQWRRGLEAHWKDLVEPHAMPKNRELLVVALRFAFAPTKRLMRTGKVLTGWIKNIEKIRDGLDKDK